jgi:hypothetical protein
VDAVEESPSGVLLPRYRQSPQLHHLAAVLAFKPVCVSRACLVSKERKKKKRNYVSHFAFFAVTFYHKGVLRYVLFDCHSMLGVLGVHISAPKIQMMITVEGYIPGPMESLCLPQRAK